MWEALLDWLPDWARALLAWVTHPHTLGVLAAVSVVTFVASAVGVPWFLARVPADYLTLRERRKLGVQRKRSWGRWMLRIAKNALGTLLLCVGFIMLFLPGQGLLSMLVGLFLVDFPGKPRVLRALLSRPHVQALINNLRARAGKPPLELPGADTRPTTIPPADTSPP